MKITDRNIITDLQNVIENLRTKGTIFSITDNTDNTYTVNVSTVLNLVNGDFITISNTTNFNSDKYQIFNLTSNSFDISLKSGFTTETGNFVQNTPLFLYGTFQTISGQLIEMSRGEYKKQKYPAIILNSDFQSEINREFQNNGYSKQTISLFFVYQSDLKKGLNNEQYQYDNVINPILIPLKNKFFETAEKSLYFTNTINNHFNYTQKISANWGVAFKNGNNANILPDWLACIETTFEITNKKIITT